MAVVSFSGCDREQTCMYSLNQLLEPQCYTCVKQTSNILSSYSLCAKLSLQGWSRNVFINGTTNHCSLAILMRGTYATKVSSIPVATFLTYCNVVNVHSDQDIFFWNECEWLKSFSESQGVIWPTLRQNCHRAQHHCLGLKLSLHWSTDIHILWLHSRRRATIMSEQAFNFLVTHKNLLECPRVINWTLSNVQIL